MLTSQQRLTFANKQDSLLKGYLAQGKGYDLHRIQSIFCQKSLLRLKFNVH